MAWWEYAIPGYNVVKIGNDIKHMSDRPGEDDRRNNLVAQGNAASNFAGEGEFGYGVRTGVLNHDLGNLRNIANGQNSVSQVQLRQALDQNLAAQRSMAASASPQNASMAALMASRNAMQAGSGLAGQQALAGIQERQAANQALIQGLLGMRGQDAQVALGSRGNAVGAYGNDGTVGRSWVDKWAGPVTSVLTAATGGK